MPINYLGTVFTVVLGCIVFKEKLFFSDIIGASMIIGFVTYNGIYPPQSKKKIENEKK
jgi:drug/metabolite transporter (DMT)-like permease